MSDIHVMTRDELLFAPESTVIWQEYRYNYNASAPLRRIQPLMKYAGIYTNCYSGYDPMDEIGTEKRFWSARPTIETMEKEKWE